MNCSHSISKNAGSLLGVAVAAAFASTAAQAQDDFDVAPQRLPRPGYEYDGIQKGNTNILIETDFQIDYDNNVFRTSQDEQDDLRFILNPSATVTQQVGTGSIVAEAHAGFTRYADIERENTNTFGTSLGLGLSPSEGQALEALVGYDRNIERRGDPETTAGPTDPPVKIDVLLAELTYRRAFGDLRLGLELGTEKYNLLEEESDDRDQQAYRASAKFGYAFNPAFTVFVQPYINVRDFRLPVDFGGVNRDTTTYGLLFGGEREIGNRLVGTVGAGVFRTDPEDAAIEPYTGLRVNTSLTWTPRQRTAVNFRLERGDVATVRSGASTRIDTIARVRVDQEIRHNLLGQVSVSYIERQYRGESRGNLTNVGGTVGLEYLLNRRLSVYTSASYVDRSALDEIDEYSSFIFSVGVRARL